MRLTLQLTDDAGVEFAKVIDVHEPNCLPNQLHKVGLAILGQLSIGEVRFQQELSREAEDQGTVGGEESAAGGVSRVA